ncbi:hypothetical protein PILCRDRAFT_830129 [Piloderma croceum F 1598]|uniref:Uncharacterized protein n=1 Tax=Piloderma croceum (strain F 1598) TaxID=765440 RepID=A0A0C3ADB2_PILCF|nr:hypothetical protein PILCRDRAFT_830129 [Piloderma croceum F 1598]
MSQAPTFGCPSMYIPACGHLPLLLSKRLESLSASIPSMCVAFILGVCANEAARTQLNSEIYYAQNLTINIITHHTGPTYSAPTPQLQVSQTPTLDPSEGRRPVADSVCSPSAEEVAAAYALAFAVAQALASLQALQST